LSQGEIFLLTFPFIGSLRSGRLNREAGYEPSAELRPLPIDRLKAVGAEVLRTVVGFLVQSGAEFSVRNEEIARFRSG
jgi:hypothetical protein